MEYDIKAVVLAAGMGKRLQTEDSDAPKVMRQVCGKPLIGYVLDALAFIPQKDIIVIVGYKKNEVIDHIRGGYTYAIQAEQLGTGHAVMSAADELSDYNGAVLVCCGDMPAIRRETFEDLISEHFSQMNDCTLLTGETSIPLAYGRVLRDENGGFSQIIEQKDCSPEQLAIKELNSGVYVFKATMLLEAVKQLKNNNSQGEYYLTDAPAIIQSKGGRVGIFCKNLGVEILGVNTVEDLSRMEEIIDEGVKPRRESDAQ